MTTGSCCLMVPQWSICQPGSALPMGTGHTPLCTSRVQLRTWQRKGPQVVSRWMQHLERGVSLSYFLVQNTVQRMCLNFWIFITYLQIDLLIGVHCGCVSVRFLFSHEELIRSHGALFTCCCWGLVLTPPPRDRYIPATQLPLELHSMKGIAGSTPSSRKKWHLPCQLLATWNGTLFCRRESTVEKGYTYRKSNCSAVKHVKNGKKGSSLRIRISFCVRFPF